MKASELRIGNWIQPNWRTDPIEVETIEYMDDNVPYKKEIGDHAINQLSSIECYEGIPLTSEWLERFGFEVQIRGTIKDYLKFNSHGVSDMLVSSINGIEWITYGVRHKIKYVHQLQNLYFALTGEELTIKE